MQNSAANFLLINNTMKHCRIVKSSRA